MSDALGYLVQFLVGFALGSALGWLMFVLPQRLRAEREAARTLEALDRFRPGCPYPDCACHVVARPRGMRTGGSEGLPTVPLGPAETDSTSPLPGPQGDAAL